MFIEKDLEKKKNCYDLTAGIISSKEMLEYHKRNDNRR